MAEAALFVLVQIPFGVDVNPVDNNTNMQMISGHIAGCADIGNSVVFVHCIANLRQKPAAMGVKGTISAAVVDDQIISITDVVPRFNDRAALHGQNRRAVGVGNVQTVVVGGILAGNTDILAFAKEGSNVLVPVGVIERIAEPATGGREGVINKCIVDLSQNRDAFAFFNFVEVGGQVMRIGIGIAFLLVIKLPDCVGKVVIAHIGKRENGVGVILLDGYGLPSHLFLHRFGVDFLGSGVGMVKRNDGTSKEDICQNQFTAYVVLAVKRKRQAYIKKKMRDKEKQTKTEEKLSKFGIEKEDVWHGLEIQNEELVIVMQQLKPKEHFIVVGYVLRRKTFKELAQETKLTERAAASTYYRSIEKLRIKIEKEK